VRATAGAEGWEWWGIEPLAIIDLEDRLLGLGRFRARGRKSGVEIDLAARSTPQKRGSDVSRIDGKPRKGELYEISARTGLRD
jgi:hypothetical protein